jgi:hypothetical protein
MLIGFAVLVVAIGRGLWREPRFWKATGIAAVVAMAIVGPLFLPYLQLERGGEFRTLDEARNYAATWREYLAASAYSTAWFRPSKWTELLFPGFVVLVFSVVGVLRGWRSAEQRLMTVLYGGIVALALWLSLGPAGGFYSVAYRWMPGFSFMRAPSRFGVVVTLALCVLQGFGVTAFLKRASRPLLWTAALLTIATAERVPPIAITPNPEIQPVYHFLATQPYGALVELPPLSRGFTRTPYMLASTVHWMPLVNAYSDFIPEAFNASLATLAGFPNRESFALLAKDNVRYVIFHLEEYRKNAALPSLEASLAAFAPSLRLLYQDDGTRLYEVITRP